VDQAPGSADAAAEVEHRDPGADAVCWARARISPAVMKLSCPTNSPAAYADTRAVQRPVVPRAVVPRRYGSVVDGVEPNVPRKRSWTALPGQTGACELGRSRPPAPPRDLVQHLGSWAMIETARRARALAADDRRDGGHQHDEHGVVVP
jgi:hypothetical protein